MVYAQLFLENAEIYAVERDLVDQVFDVFVRDCSRHALDLHMKPASTAAQMELALRMVRKPVVDAARYGRVWQLVHGLHDAYEMAP